MFRGALARAVSDAGAEGIGHEELAIKVTDALSLDYSE